jgi:hypothetical protein
MLISLFVYFRKFYFRWHQIILFFGSESAILRFDNQSNDEIEVSLNLSRSSGKFNMTNVAFVGASKSQKDSF